MVLSKQQEEDIKHVSKKVLKDSLSDTSFMSVFADALAEMVFSKLSEKFESLNSKLNEANDTVLQLCKENNELKNRVEDLEQKMKITQLRMYGVKEKKGENLPEVVSKLLIDKNVLENESGLPILSCYRIGLIRPGNKKPRPIIIKFRDENQRNLAYSNKKNLKGSKMVLTEDLIKSRYNCLCKAKEKFGKENVWSQSGNICIKMDGHKHIVKSLMELENISMDRNNPQ